jgi:hypothetical protein
MTKSIEMVWKEGFIKEANLSAPRVNDLYNRKSQNIVDKLQQMFVINVKGIIIGSLVMLAVLSFMGLPFLGLYIFLLLIPLIIIVKKELKKSTNLNKGQSSYDYLRNFNTWLKGSIKTYSDYYKLFYPLLFLGMSIQGMMSDKGAEFRSLMLEWLPTNFVILGQPYYIYLCVIVLMVVVARYAEAFYRWDLNMIYGRQFKKLEELIADMEELRQ